MFKTYIKLTLRQLWKYRSYVIINTFGLGIALACCVTAYLLLAFNVEFDSHLDSSKYENVYRVHTDAYSPNGEIVTNVVAPLGLAPIIKEDIAGIEEYVRILSEWGFVKFGDNTFSESVDFADPNFFNFFDYEVISGSLEGFDQKNYVIISDEIAEKYFKDENPVGKILTFNFANQKKIQVEVGAVIAQVPVNSSIYFSFLMHSDHFLDIHQLSNTEMGDWKDPAVLVKLSSTSNSGDYKDLMQKYVARRNELKEDAKVISFHFEPFLEPINQDDVYWSRLNLRLSNMPIIVFITMAVLILLIACFNLTNTTIATTSKRFKEVGIRKVVGASRKQIIIQFLLEMTFTVLISLVVAIIVSSYIVGEFAAMWGLPFGLRDLNGLNLIFALLFLVFISSLLAGLYPALHNSKIKPVTLLSNKVRLKGGSWFTNLLVSLQFSISVIVLINGIVFIQNAKFQESIDYGFDMQKILTVFIQNESEYKILKQRIEANPRVKSIAVSHHQLGMSSYPFPVFIDTTEYSVQHIEIGENFFQTMGLELVMGRFPDINMTRDEFESIVVNEAFIEHAGISGDPLLATVKVRDQKRRIIGVVKNHVDNLFRSDEPEPFVYYGSKRNEYQVMLIKAAAKDLVNVKDDVESIWKEEFPDKAFTAEFQEELTLGGLRQTNSNMKKIFIFLTILGTLLSASGIFALSSLNVDKRIKEIGVRKVLGGSVNHIIFMLGKSFTLMLLISIVFGSAVGYYLSTSLLDNIYAYHIQVNIWPLLLASIIILIVGVLSTTSIIWKAAVANPVESLRSE